MLFGLGGRVHDSRNQYDLSLETPGYSSKFKKSPTAFSNVLFLKMSGRWKLFIEMLEHTRATDPEDPSNQFLKTLNIGAISSIPHEMTIIEDLEDEINIYNMSLECGNMGSTYTKEHEMDI